MLGKVAPAAVSSWSSIRRIARAVEAMAPNPARQLGILAVWV